MGKQIVVEINEDGEFVWGGLMDSELFTTLLEFADKFSDKTMEISTAPTVTKEKEKL